MAISTYSELKDSLADWMHRGGLTAIIPDCIVLCETDFNRRLRIAPMEVRATAPFDEAFENLPSDFLELREVKIDSPTQLTLEYMPPQLMTQRFPILSGNTPTHYSLMDSQIRLNAIPASEVEITYYTRIPALTDLAPTNWMLTNNPDVYLYGSLAMAELFTKNDKRTAVWGALYERAIKAVEVADKHSRWSGSALQIRAA